MNIWFCAVVYVCISGHKSQSFTRAYTKIEYLKNRHQYVQTRAKDLDSKAKIARLSQYEVLRTCEPPSFWESVIAVVTLPRL